MKEKSSSDPEVNAPRLRLLPGGATELGSNPPPIAPADEEAPELNLRLLQPLVRWVKEERGEAALGALADEVGLTVAELESGTRWTTAARFEAILEACRELVPDDEAFVQACAHRMTANYGPLRYLVSAAQPAMLFRQAARNFHLVSRVSALEVNQTAPRVIEAKYTSTAPESRLMCLSRQAQMREGPTLWGLPAAQLVEHGCVAHGDSACVYELRLYETRRWLPSLLGLAIGALAGAALYLTGLGLLPFALAFALAGMAAGHVYELHRTNRENMRLGEEANEVLRGLVRDEAEARLELGELHGRQRRWAQLLEEQLSERSATMAQVLERIEKLGEERAHHLRGVSHDLNNPLQVLMSSTAALAEEGVDPTLIEDMDTSIDRMRTLLAELMQRLSEESRAVPLSHEPVDVGELTEAVRRRMRALAWGRDIRVSVFRSREAPDSVRCDATLMDRVIDNLLTNAAKYTSEGSVIVEIGGTPGQLTLKVSDTGRGIEPDELDRIFEANGSRPDRRAPHSFGVGLSVVVNLLARIGGRLEVMSKPDVGTTFWAHFPENPTETAPRGHHRSPTETTDVVTIRRSHDQ